MAIKKLKEIEVTLIGCGDAVTLNASDTVTEPNASYALDEFKAEKQMKFKNNDNTYYVPFHAVDHIVVGESETEVADRPSPYDCEPSGGGTDGDTVTVTFTNGFYEPPVAKVGTHDDGTDECEDMVDNPMKVKVGTTIILPSCVFDINDQYLYLADGRWADASLDGVEFPAGTEYTVTKDVTLEYSEPQG